MVEAPNPKMKGKATSQPWSMEEEIALARSWIDTSKDVATGNSQAAEHFWQQVTERFHRELGCDAYRSKHSLTTKYRDVNKLVTKFNELHHNLKTQHKNGQTDQNIFETALEKYRQENNGKAFKYVEFWKIIEPCGVWHDMNEEEKGAPTKRTKTSESSCTKSSDARVQSGLNEDDDDELELEELLRPIGRDKAKRKGSSSSASGSYKSDDITKMATEFVRYNMKLDARMEFEQEILAKKEKSRQEKQKAREDKQRLKDMKFLMKPTTDLEGDALQMVLQYKEYILKKYNK